MQIQKINEHWDQIGRGLQAVNKDLPTRLRNFKATIESAEQQAADFIESRAVRDKIDSDDRGRQGDTTDHLYGKVEKPEDNTDSPLNVEEILIAALEEV